MKNRVIIVMRSFVFTAVAIISAYAVCVSCGSARKSLQPAASELVAPKPEWAGKVASIPGRTNREILENAKWETTELAKGLKLSICSFDTLYGLPQHLSMLEIDPKFYRFEFVDHDGMKQTSTMATAAHEVAALNGTFYDMDLGNSVAYLQIRGLLLDTSRHDDVYPQINGALKINKGKIKIVDWSPAHEAAQRAKIEKDAGVKYGEKKDHLGKPSPRFVVKSKKENHISYMAAQPMLIKNGQPVLPLADMPGFNVKKHNRSIVFTKKGKVYFLIIDGRAKGKAEGMSIAEMHDLLLFLGAEQALNIDGGGSSTLWLSEPYKGSQIVNFPSDNHQFDHAGERHISNHIGVYRK